MRVAQARPNNVANPYSVAMATATIPLSSHHVQDVLCGSFSCGHMKGQLKPIPVSMTALVMRSYHCHGNRNVVVVCLCLIVSNYSLDNNQLTSTGAIVLARALQHNKSLEELK